MLLCAFTVGKTTFKRGCSLENFCLFVLRKVHASLADFQTPTNAEHSGLAAPLWYFTLLCVFFIIYELGKTLQIFYWQAFIGKSMLYCDSSVTHNRNKPQSRWTSAHRFQDSSCRHSSSSKVPFGFHIFSIPVTFPSCSYVMSRNVWFFSRYFEILQWFIWGIFMDTEEVKMLKMLFFCSRF